MTDSELLDWLEVDPDRLEDVRGTCNNENITVRKAIEHLISLDAYKSIISTIDYFCGEKYAAAVEESIHRELSRHDDEEPL